MLALADGFAHFGGARAEVQVEAPFEPLLDEIAVPAAAAPLPPKVASKATVCAAATLARQCTAGRSEW